VKFSDYFERVYCINLESRPGRLERFKNRLKRATGETIDNKTIFRFDAVDGNKLTEFDMPTVMDGNERHWGSGAEGCRRSHLGILTEARDLGLDNILILEDDVIFRNRSSEPVYEGFENLLAGFMDNVPENWDMIYLGGNHWRGTGEQVSGMVHVINSLTTHAYAVRHTAYQLIITNAVQHNKPIDLILAEEVQPHCNAYSSLPRIVGQEAGISDITKSNSDSQGILGCCDDEWDQE
jgi:GR25 family glycosyltransferase involved in LPS biosynthesis